MRRSTVFVVLGLAGILGAVSYEALRSRPPQADPVASREPLRPDETSRMEGGLVWRFSRSGEDVFEMHAESIVGLEDGAQLLDDVSRLLLFMEDGRPVELRSREGALKQQGRRGSEEVEIVLRGDVVVEDPDGTVLKTEALRYDAERRVAFSPGPALVESPDFTADVESFEYRPDARLLETRGQLVVRTRGESAWTIDAQRSRYRLGTGEFVFAEPFRMSQPGHALVSGPAVVTLPREGRRGVFSGKGPVLAASEDPRAEWQLSSAAMAAFEEDPASGAERELSFGPPSSIVARTAPGASTPGEGTLGTAQWLFSPGDTPGSLRVQGGPGFAARWTPAEEDGGVWRATGDALEMLRLEDGAVATMEASGSVEIRGPDDVSVFGDALRWAAVLPQEIRVRGERQGAQAFQGEDLIEAPLLRVLREQKIVVGEEGAITEIRSVAGGRGSLFEGSDPLRVRSRRVLAPLDADRETIFEGPVKAWQFDTTLDASRMRFQRTEERLIAESSEGRPVRGRFVLGEEGRAPRTVLMMTELLDYFAKERRAQLVGGASFKDGPLVVNSRRMDVTLGEEGGIERLEAIGRVVLEHRDDEAECERLVWTGGDAGVIELFGASPLASLYASEQNQTVRSARIRYYPETRTFETEGAGGRTVIGAPQADDEEPEDGNDGER